jgi:transcriptional regulator with XRE-family HTH domain
MTGPAPGRHVSRSEVPSFSVGSVDEIAFGRGLRAIRIRKRLTQEDLGAGARVSRSVIARIEQGHAALVTVATLERVAGALAARVLVKLLWQGEGLERLLDSRHAITVEEVVRILRSAGWEVATEVSFNEYGERGSVDVLAFHPVAHVVLVVEIKTTIGDAQEVQATLDRKVRLAPKISRSRGWQATAVATLLVVVESRSNRATVARLGATFAVAFPARNLAIRRWLRAPHRQPPLRGLHFLNSGPQAVVTQRVRPRRKRATHDGEPPD